MSQFNQVISCLEGILTSEEVTTIRHLSQGREEEAIQEIFRLWIQTKLLIKKAKRRGISKIKCGCHLATKEDSAGN